MRRLTMDSLGRIQIGDEEPSGMELARRPPGHHRHHHRQVPPPTTTSGATRTQITKPEYALLTVAVAQKLTGSKTATPTAKQLAEAQKQAQAAVLKAGLGVKGGTGKIDKLFNQARNQLSGITGMGAEECGGLWEDIKNAIVKAAPAMPFIAPAAGLVAATAPIIMAKNAKRGGQGGQAAPKAPPADASNNAPSSSQSASASPASPAPASPAPASASAETDPSTAVVVGARWPLLEGEDIASVYRDAEDALIFGEGGGDSELGAANRMSTPYYFPPTTAGDEDPSVISPLAYRVAVMQRAGKLAKGRKPSTKHMYDAQKSVDHDLAGGGISVQIPGAKPGRVTR
jgi:hypothetical protein